MPAPTPPVLPQPFANNATGGTINTIPNTTVTPDLASYNLGFPAITMQPIIAGGKPPHGQDFNGILFAITSHLYYLQAGQLYQYNSTVAAAIGGYAVGTVLGMADGTGAWINQTAANMTDPDGGGAAGWVPEFSYGIQTINVTGGAVTLTPAQTRRGILVFTGGLSGNAIVSFPTTFQRWLIINNTTGAFTLTVKTISGSGLLIPQSGYGGPMEVYGNGTNLYPAVTPLVLPTAVAPDPNTIALRSSAGYLFATYLNQSSVIENFAMSCILAQTGSDGYNRKISLANFQAQLALQNFAGAVTNGQVPLSTVSQHFSNVTTNPGGFGLSGGFQVRRGSIFVGDVPVGINTLPVVFSSPFPNACLDVVTSFEDTLQCNLFTCANSQDAAGFNYVYQEAGASVQNATLHYVAIGF